LILIFSYYYFELVRLQKYSKFTNQKYVLTFVKRYLIQFVFHPKITYYFEGFLHNKFRKTKFLNELMLYYSIFVHQKY